MFKYLAFYVLYIYKYFFNLVTIDISQKMLYTIIELFIIIYKLQISYQRCSIVIRIIKTDKYVYYCAIVTTWHT